MRRRVLGSVCSVVDREGRRRFHTAIPAANTTVWAPKDDPFHATGVPVVIMSAAALLRRSEMPDVMHLSRVIAAGIKTLVTNAAGGTYS